MKLQFDPNQQFQLDAVSAIADLFEGQPQSAPEYSVIKVGSFGDLFAGHEQTELGIGNKISIAEDKLKENLQAVQLRNDIEAANQSFETWDHFDVPANQPRLIPHFSVEMETGTGKTYVYLRTIFELSRRYGFQKFIIVVPSVAIREGVLKNIEITAEHFKALYNNLAFEYFVYDAKKVNRLRHFATSNTLQIQIINIDSFRKNFTGTDDERKSNVIYKEMNQLGGRAAIEFVQAARPIVIIDEPQSVDGTEKSQEAIKALNPLMTLRYSATHRNPYNLVYRLDPVKAFELRLVKQIVVASAIGDTSANTSFVKVEEVEYKKGIKAKVRIHVQSNDGPKEKAVAVKQGDDLFHKSGELALYRDGYQIAEISAEPGSEYVRLSNGKTMRLGQEIGGIRDDIWKVQVKHTVKKHLEKELQVQARGIKVLSLFFIDRVANYRDYGSDGKSIAGKFAHAFVEAFTELSKEDRFKDIPWIKEPIEKLHNGYFAQDKKGTLKDTNGSTQADDDVYNLIMKDKERLLSIDEPLRFIFSHSALREGWDNPNVFQICTLNEGRSVIKKRQEIGRGLRLPVDQSGVRVFDESVNKLYVMANESYEDFARSLQTEYEEDCGVTFGKVPITAFAKLLTIVNGEEKPIGKEAAEVIKASLVEQKFIDKDGKIQPSFDPKKTGFTLTLPKEFSELVPSVVDLLSQHQIEKHIRREKDERVNRLKKEIALSPEFKALWDQIKPRTTYRVEFKTDDLISKAVEAIDKMAKIETPKIHVNTGLVKTEKGGVTTQAVSSAIESPMSSTKAIPDVLAYLQNETELTRSTLVKILKISKRLDEVFVNPQKFMDQVASIIKYELHRLLIDGIKYEKLAKDAEDSEWQMVLFKNEELIDYLNSLEVTKSIYEHIVYDSEIEKEFAKKLDEREDIKLFVKLPAWFKVETPIGSYNPDWAIIKQDGKAFYLIRETKGTKDFLKLRTSEADKIRCGVQHFKELGVDYDVVVTANEV
jgi:type III restriction enzyme